MSLRFQTNRLGLNMSASPAMLEKREMLASSASLTGFERAEVGKYMAQNNPWGADDIYAVESSFTGSGDTATMTVTKNNASTTDDIPVAFPAVYVGDNWGFESPDQSLSGGVLASDINSADFTLSSNGGTATGVYNTGMDVWLGSKDSNNNAEQYLMIQNYNAAPDGGLGQPAGEIVRENASIPGANGTYDVWYGGNHDGTAVVTYLRSDSSGSTTTGDLKEFLTDAIDNNYIDESKAVTNVFAGSEIWNGGVGTEVSLTTDFDIA